MSTPSVSIKAHARRLGFDVIGIARADLPLDADFERYRAFVDAGRHGDMEWLAHNRGVRERLDGDGILAGAKSVICLARAYRRADDDADPPTARAIARYARGRDYHNVVGKRLRRLAAIVRRIGPGVHARALCDAVPVLERAWAARAGLGFVGKNGMLIVPGVGSFVLLGEVVTTLELEPDAPMPERCGACTRCLDACPTQAFAAPFVLDARRCISYLTIEQRSAIDETLREDVGDHLFGCDDCQTVCPFNAAEREVGDASFTRPLAAWGSRALVDLLEADGVDLSGSPVRRATAEGLARNAAVVLGNRRDANARDALARAAREHPSSVVRDAATWALSRLRA